MMKFIGSFLKLFLFIGVLAVTGTAFAFQMGVFSPPGREISNPSFTPIFETGGTGDSNGVNVNNPKIGSCLGQNSQGIYDVSTCLPAVDDQLRLMGQNYVQSLMMMATQFSSTMMQQMQILGAFFDAKEQLDMQRDLQILSARAQKDYHPSEQLCSYGTGIRSLANTEERGRQNQRALSAILLEYYGNKENTIASEGFSKDIQARLDKFKTVYCDPQDNNSDLWRLCLGQPDNTPSRTYSDQEKERFNKDIDYHRSLAQPLTIDVDFTDATQTPAEEDLIALARNLYWERALDPSSIEQFDRQAYLAARSIMARSSLAHNSFTNIVGMKSKSPLKPDPSEEIKSGGAHLKAVLRDFGMTEAQIEEMFGKNPSYYAQMEILSKTIYQHPNFYTNLYDKPTNVARTNAAMSAIRLMQLRDRFDSQTRREMLMAALLEDGLFPEEARVYALIQTITEAE